MGSYLDYQRLPLVGDIHYLSVFLSVPGGDCTILAKFDFQRTGLSVFFLLQNPGTSSCQVSLPFHVYAAVGWEKQSVITVPRGMTSMSTRGMTPMNV